VVNEEGVRALWKGLTPFATHLTLKYALRMGSNSMYQVMLQAALHCALWSAAPVVAL
jgi:solute carrier family 25 citrate transporter 1